LDFRDSEPLRRQDLSRHQKKELGVPKLTWPRIAAWRVQRHQLNERARAENMFAVVTRLCGLHAQVLSSALLTLWARIEDIKRDAVRRALWEDRSLVKTWAMRGTLHLLAVDDLPLWHAALSTSRRYRKPGLWRRFGLTLDELDRLTEAVGDALDGCVMTREELAQKVGNITGSVKFARKLAFGSWGTILKPAAMTGRLCFAPSVGQRVRFTARQWISTLGDEVAPVEVEGQRAWMMATDAREARELSPKESVRLVPAFDQYVIGASRHAENLLTGGLRSQVYRPQGWVSPVLLVDGFMRGVWFHEIKGSRVQVVINPFLKVPSWVRRGAEEEAERLAGFLGCNLKLTWNSSSR